MTNMLLRMAQNPSYQTLDIVEAYQGAALSRPCVFCQLWLNSCIAQPPLKALFEIVVRVL